MITLNHKYSKIVLVNNLIQSAMEDSLKISQLKLMSFGSVFRPLHCLARSWGLAPFSIAIDSNGELQRPKIHLCDGLWAFAITLLYASFVNYSVEAFNFARTCLDKETWILILCARILTIFAFVYGILTIIINLCNRFKLINMIKMFVRFDEEVCRIGLLGYFCDIFHSLFSLDGKNQDFLRLLSWPSACKVALLRLSDHFNGFSVDINVDLHES